MLCYAAPSRAALDQVPLHMHAHARAYARTHTTLVGCRATAGAVGAARGPDTVVCVCGQGHVLGAQERWVQREGRAAAFARRNVARLRAAEIVY